VSYKLYGAACELTAWYIYDIILLTFKDSPVRLARVTMKLCAFVMPSFISLKGGFIFLNWSCEARKIGDE
jgi:hypothetical protein